MVRFTVFYVIVAQMMMMMMLENVLALKDYLLLRDCDQYFQNVMRVGFRICSTLIAAVFWESLCLTQAGRKRFTVGKITNIMTTDVDALQQICPQSHALCVKAKVLNVQDDEISWFSKAQLLAAANTCFANAVPVLVTVVAFGSYTMLGGILTLAKAFTSLSLFVALRFSLTMFPTLVTAAVNANVSLKRLQELLLAEEHMLQENPPLESGVPAILIKNGTFSWEPNAGHPTLSNINLEIEVGSLVDIVGSTGEGKTSIVSAFLGEIPAIFGSQATL
ncbi:unnamed protein product [Sphagnum jensenii]